MPILAPKMAPFGHPFGIQNRSKHRSEIGLLKKSFQDRPKIAQDPPKMPPGPPRSAQNAFPDPPGQPKKFELVENKSKKKVDNGHPQWSPAPVLTKTESTFTTVGTQRVAAVVARSALQ